MIRRVVPLSPPPSLSLQNNRTLMGKEAKKAAKLEKKLKILLGGYMVSVM